MMQLQFSGRSRESEEVLTTRSVDLVEPACAAYKG